MFLFFKIYFWHQCVKTIWKNKKKLKQRKIYIYFQKRFWNIKTNTFLINNLLAGLANYISLTLNYPNWNYIIIWKSMCAHSIFIMKLKLIQQQQNFNSNHLVKFHHNLEPARKYMNWETLKAWWLNQITNTHLNSTSNLSNN
jgi:hypothetical protein